MICVTYLDYISRFLVCHNFPITSKTVVFWNILESSPARTFLIEYSHKWNQILFFISNTKLRIWLSRKPKIYVNSQSNFYDYLTLDHTNLCPEINIIWSPSDIKTTYPAQIIYISYSRHGWPMWNGGDPIYTELVCLWGGWQQRKHHHMMVDKKSLIFFLIPKKEVTCCPLVLLGLTPIGVTQLK